MHIQGYVLHICKDVILSHIQHLVTVLTYVWYFDSPYTMFTFVVVAALKISLSLSEIDCNPDLGGVASVCILPYNIH